MCGLRGKHILALIVLFFPGSAALEGVVLQLKALCGADADPRRALASLHDAAGAKENEA
jgi:hypothetical protein